METNQLSISIQKPLAEVFEFTTHPKNTHLRVSFIDEEVTDMYPPVVGTVYRNRRGDVWNKGVVTEFEDQKLFKLENDAFFVKYSYRKISDVSTELVYLECIKEGTLTNSFTQDVLEKLKMIIEDL